MAIRKKIQTQSELIRTIAALKRGGKKIVTVNGSFDLMHAGHLRMLEEAKRQGDVLAVLVNSDASVKAYKGPARPIVPEAKRAELLAALAPVDYVTIFQELTPTALLARLRPHVHCNGPEWGRFCIERPVVEAGGGRIHILRFHPGRSTSRIVEKVLASHRAPRVRAIFMDRDGTLNAKHPDVPYVHRHEDFRLLPFVIPTLRKFSRTDYKLIVITNQSGIGRGLYRISDMNRVHALMRREFAAAGVRLDGIYYCHHAPEAGCGCRKPAPGMFLRAAKDFGIALSESWMVGDDDRDVLAGREVNVKTIKLAGRMNPAHRVRPHFYARDFREAGRIILGARQRIQPRASFRRRSHLPAPRASRRPPPR